MKLYHTVFFFKILFSVILRPKFTHQWLRLNRVLRLSQEKSPSGMV
jgi:hypothetical protein